MLFVNLNPIVLGYKSISTPSKGRTQDQSWEKYWHATHTKEELNKISNSAQIPETEKEKGRTQKPNICKPIS